MSRRFRLKILFIVDWNKTGTFRRGMLYVDNPELAGDRRACRIGERIGSF
jgi:hypothetical protein